MSKAFTKESDSVDSEVEEPDAMPTPAKNYVTPGGLTALQEEFRKLLYEERPKVVEIVSWAAGNGDRSENGDYIYGTRPLREIDRRVRHPTKASRLARPDCHVNSNRGARACGAGWDRLLDLKNQIQRIPA